jgi:hypothetical protein
MMDRRNQLTSDEASGWEEAALGPLFPSYLALLNQGPSELPTIKEESLTPLQQVLITNSAGAALASKFPKIGALGSNSLIENALRFRSGKPQIELLLGTASHAYAWFPLSTFYLRALNEKFADNVSLLLFQSGVARSLSEERRAMLNHLIFHPLQNARDHVFRTYPRVFSGISARIVQGIEPATSSVLGYVAHTRSKGFTSAYLELVIHDDGPGIAYHYYRSAYPDSEPLYSRPIESEALFLKSAFERHTTSKTFKQSTSSLANPGIGLAALLNAVKGLDAYLELRTGRLRVYRWYGDNDPIFGEATFYPDHKPVPLQVLPGTVFRFFIPIED